MTKAKATNKVKEPRKGSVLWKVEVFDEDAQYHGWLQFEGAAAEAARAKASYEKSKEDLVKHIQRMEAELKRLRKFYKDAHFRADGFSIIVPEQ